MAYPKIDTLLADDEAQKANIFAPAEVTGEEQAGAPGIPKTTTEGQVGGGQGAQQAQQKAQQVQDTAADRGSREVIRRNIGKQRAPKLLEKLGGQIQSAEQQLGQESESFVEGIRQQDYAIPESQLEAAIAPGGEAEQQQVKQRLGTEYQAPEFDPQTQYRFDALENLSAAMGAGGSGRTSALDEWARGALRSEAGPQYTAGESALDLALLKATPGYQQSLTDLSADYGQLGQLGQNIGLETTLQGADVGRGLYSAATEAAKGYLGGQADVISQENIAEAQAENQARQQMREAGIHEDYINEVIAGFGEDRSLPGFVQETLSGIDPSSYYGGQVGAEQFVSPEEEQRFNAIQAILGGDDIVASGQLDPRFRKQEFTDLLRSGALEKEQAYNVGLQQRIDAILGGATPEQGYFPAALKASIPEIQAQLAQEMGLQTVPGAFEGAPDVSQFYDPSKVSGVSFLGDPGYQELSGLYEQLESGAAPERQDVGLGFDRGAYEDALRGYLAQQQQVTEEAMPEAVTPPPGDYAVDLGPADTGGGGVYPVADATPEQQTAAEESIATYVPAPTTAGTLAIDTDTGSYSPAPKPTAVPEIDSRAIMDLLMGRGGFF